MEPDTKTLSELVLAQARADAYMTEISRLREQLEVYQKHVEELNGFLREWGIHFPNVDVDND
jgi:hypothetical protein